VASEENQFGGALCQFCGHLLKPFKAILWVLFIVLLWLAYKNEKVAKFLFKLQNYIKNTCKFYSDTFFKFSFCKLFEQVIGTFIFDVHFAYQTYNL
jgi:hypothetical protein